MVKDEGFKLFKLFKIFPCWKTKIVAWTTITVTHTSLLTEALTTGKLVLLEIAFKLPWHIVSVHSDGTKCCDAGKVSTERSPLAPAVVRPKLLITILCLSPKPRLLLHLLRELEPALPRHPEQCCGDQLSVGDVRVHNWGDH